MSTIISLSVVPKGTSINPVFLTCPVRANVFVPLDLSVPVFMNSPAPFPSTIGMVARVSTLLMTVGFPNKPEVEGYGGLGDGIPLLPSMEAIRAVSSPQTNAPAPSITVILKSILPSNAPLPIIPYSSAFLTAAFILATARGYSILT